MKYNYLNRKYGFNRQNRPSFLDLLDDLKQQNPNMHYFLPSMNGKPYLDQNLQPVAIPPHANLGSRLTDLNANTSKACTSERHIVENSFSRVFGMKLSGNLYPISHQLTLRSGTLPTPDLPKIAIWLGVIAVIRRLGTPFHLKYGLAHGVTSSIG